MSYLKMGLPSIKVETQTFINTNTLYNENSVW